MTDDDLMPFGKHKGVKMMNVPAHYLHWFWLNGSADSNDARRVMSYIEDNITVLKDENKDLIWKK